MIWGGCSRNTEKLAMSTYPEIAGQKNPADSLLSGKFFTALLLNCFMKVELDLDLIFVDFVLGSRFHDRRDAEDAMDSLDGRVLDGRELRVQMARWVLKFCLFCNSLLVIQLSDAQIFVSKTGTGGQQALITNGIVVEGIAAHALDHAGDVVRMEDGQGDVPGQVQDHASVRHPKPGNGLAPGLDVVGSIHPSRSPPLALHVLVRNPNPSLPMTVDEAIGSLNRGTSPLDKLKFLGLLFILHSSYREK